MNLLCFLLLCIIWSAASPLTCSSDEGILVQQQQQINDNHNASVEIRSSGKSGRWGWKQHQYYKHRGLRTVHGTLCIMGWGVLFPTSVIIARYLKESSEDWHYLHILIQLSAFFLGTLGWGLGISIKHEHRMNTHGILGTIIFALATIQLLGMCLKPDEEHECRKYWAIYHSITSYALILLIIANIFERISNHNAPNTWDFFYGAVLVVLGVITLALQLLRWMYV